MALNLPTIIEYLEGADVTPDFETARAEATVFIDSSDESTATLAMPAAMALAAGLNDEVEPLGGKTYVGNVADVPTLLIRRVAA